MIIDWWNSLSAKLAWDDPMFLVGLAALIIPVVLWALGLRQSKRDSKSQAKQARRDSELQAKFLESQTLVSQRQRREQPP